MCLSRIDPPQFYQQFLKRRMFLTVLISKVAGRFSPTFTDLNECTLSHHDGSGPELLNSLFTRATVGVVFVSQRHSLSHFSGKERLFYRGLEKKNKPD